MSLCNHKFEILCCAFNSSNCSSKETLINVEAKHAALEQKIKFSDAVEEQQRVLKKLKLQQEFSETIAEEAVHEEALSIDEHQFECDETELPKETPEQLIDPCYPSNRN